MYTLALALGKCVATLRGAFCSVFLNGTRFFIVTEVVMSHEKEKILTQRIIWFIILLIGVIITVAIATTHPGYAKMIDSNCYIGEYYESLDSTTCELEVTFDTEVSSGYVTVAFYNDRNKLIENKTSDLYGYGKTLSATFYVDGKADSYKIIDCWAEISKYPTYMATLVFVIIDIVAFAFFICSLLLSCKIYKYNNCKILVYAGWYHHYIKVNGVKTDEHNTFVSFVPIYLSCTLDDGTDIDATISMTNRIALKINNMLYTKTK